MKRIISIILLASTFTMTAPLAQASTVICWGDRCVDVADIGVWP